MPRGKLYAIFDNVAEDIAGPIMVHRHDASAIRMFTDILLDPRSMAHQHPEDYDLLCLGELNDDHNTLSIDGTNAFTVLTGRDWTMTQQQLKVDK